VIEPGSRIGRFRLERPLGQGAMGNVYLAVDPEIEREVAIKIVRTDLAEADRRDEIQTRFLREAKIAGRLQHPNIVTIYDVGREDGLTFIAMEYVDGRPLSRLLRPDVAMTDAQRFAIARETAEALSHAHERQVIHRDVKPGNILVRKDGVVKVSDFGIGKLLTESGDLTRTGMMVGSPSYMSPEQIRGETLDGRSDIFSLGVVLYEMFTGARPFPGETVTALVYQILHTEPRDPAAVRPDLPPHTAEILRKALAKKREARYDDARALIRDISRAADTSSARDSSARAVTRGFTVPEATPLPGRGADAHSGPGAASGSSSTVIVERRGGAALLFGIAAVVLAAAAFLFVLTQPRRGAVSPAVAPRSEGGASGGVRAAVAPPKPASATPSASAAPTVPSAAPVSTSSASVSPAASPDAPEAAMASDVGRPRENAKKDDRPPGGASRAASPKTGAASGDAPFVMPGEPAGPPGPPAESAASDRVYHVRRGMKFQISPDQARISVDGRNVGIADDWDDHGGGKVFPLTAGVHRVKAALPGYKDLNLQIVVAPSADHEIESAGDDMPRTSRESYPRIGKLDEETEGDVFFSPELGAARVAVDGREVGVASQFTAARPLRLAGPMVHDLLLTDGGKSRSLRVLSASTAGKNRIMISEKLK